MKTSGISMNKQSREKKTAPKRAEKTAILLLWILLWQVLTVLVGKPYILAGPLDTLRAFLSLVPQTVFWLSVFNTLRHIIDGFCLAFFAGVILGGLAFRFPLLDEFLSPLLRFMKSAPVVSFAILALIWFGSEKLTAAVVVPVVFPLIYFAVQSGLDAADGQLLEMARLFRVPTRRILLQIFRPAAMPYLISACRSALSMSWKAGIAAEIIGTPLHSVGEQLYLAKLSMATAEVFAWTATVILFSAAFEKAVLLLLEKS